MATCLADLSDLAAVAEDFVAIIKSGHIDLSKLFSDASKMVIDIEKIKADCPIPKFEEFSEKSSGLPRTVPRNGNK